MLALEPIKPAVHHVQALMDPAEPLLDTVEALVRLVPEVRELAPDLGGARGGSLDALLRSSVMDAPYHPIHPRPGAPSPTQLESRLHPQPVHESAAMTNTAAHLLALSAPVAPKEDPSASRTKSRAGCDQTATPEVPLAGFNEGGGDRWR